MKFERLRSLREKKGMPQGKAAKHMGIVRTTYSNYEAGNREPDNETLKKMADFYGTTTDFLLGRDKEEFPVEETSRQKKIRILHELADQAKTEKELDSAIIVLESIFKK